MSGYRDVITLITKSVAISDEGVPSEAETEYQAFCNRYTVGLSSYMAGLSSGLHADAEVELRSCDYAGQQDADYGGVRYSVERVSDSGEFTRLTLSRRLADG